MNDTDPEQIEKNIDNMICDMYGLSQDEASFIIESC